MNTCSKCNYSVEFGKQADINSFIGPCTNGHQFSFLPAKKKTVQISFLASDYTECAAEVRMLTMSERTWRDDFDGYKIDRLLPLSGDPVTHFDFLEDGGCYQAIRSVVDARCEVDAEVLEQEAALALMRIMKADHSNCHIHHNVTLYGISGGIGFSNRLQQFDGILRGHLIEPTYAMVMEAKMSIHPEDFDQVLKKAALFKECVSEAQRYVFSSGWVVPNSSTSSFQHFANVKHVIPCLAGRRFPDNLVRKCLEYGIIPVFPSGARYAVKGLELLKKISK